MTLRINGRIAIAFAVLLASTAAMLAAATAGATVPPKNCGKISVASRAYQIKADQLRCTTAKDHARRYLRAHDAPSGWRCRDYRNSSLKFRCTRGDRVIFAIKR